MGVGKSKKREELTINKIHNEATHFTQAKPIKKELIDELYKYESAICKIKFGTSNSGTGFFCEINDDKIPFKKALFTNYHVLNKESIGINKEIKFEYCKEEKSIIITKNRRVFTKIELDYTCIEIFDTDNINKFFRFEENIDKNLLETKEILML